MLNNKGVNTGRMFPLHIAAQYKCNFIFSGFSAKRATMVFMEYTSGKILHMEVRDNAEAGKKSAAMEGLLLQRGIETMEQYGLKIKEVVTDASSTFITFFGKYLLFCNGAISQNDICYILNYVVVQVIYATVPSGGYVNGLLQLV